MEIFGTYSFLFVIPCEDWFVFVCFAFLSPRLWSFGVLFVSNAQAVLSRAELLLSSGSSGKAALDVVVTAMGAAVDAWSRLEAEETEKRRKEAEIIKYKMQEHVVRLGIYGWSALEANLFFTRVCFSFLQTAPLYSRISVLLKGATITKFNYFRPLVYVWDMWPSELLKPYE